MKKTGDSSKACNVSARVTFLCRFFVCPVYILFTDCAVKFRAMFPKAHPLSLFCHQCSNKSLLNPQLVFTIRTTKLRSFFLSLKLTFIQLGRFYSVKHISIKYVYDKGTMDLHQLVKVFSLFPINKIT